MGGNPGSHWFGCVLLVSVGYFFCVCVVAFFYFFKSTVGQPCLLFMLGVAVFCFVFKRLGIRVVCLFFNEVRGKWETGLLLLLC